MPASLTLLQEERREKDEAVILRMSGNRKRKAVEEAVTRPGDPGWVGRARVPQVEQGEYVRRPDWQTDVTVSNNRKKGVESVLLHSNNEYCSPQINLLEKHKRKFADRKRTARTTTMNKISIEGARMDL